jgi:hypothetical protein
MFVGRSPEEAELAGEEMGSLGDIFKKVFGIAKTPAGAVAASFILPTGAVTAIKAVQAANAVAQAGKAGKAAQAARSASAARNAGPSGSGPVAAVPAASAPAGDSSSSTTSATAGSMMGAAPVMSDAEVMRYIEREADPQKRQRMVWNHQRDKVLRSGVSGSASVVDDVVGQLYARQPVDDRGRPFLHRGHCATILKALRARGMSQQAAKAALISYVKAGRVRLVNA